MVLILPMAFQHRETETPIRPSSDHVPASFDHIVKRTRIESWGVRMHREGGVSRGPGSTYQLLIRHLSVRWAINPQYSFGWFVPVISAYLFLIRWRSRPAVKFAWDPWTRLARFETVLLGERNLGQQVLEIVIFGYATPQEAEAALRRQMEDLIRT